MPNRILRETILTSRAVNRLTAEEEVFYRRLMSIVDDWGRYEADLEILLPRIYPLQLDRHTTVTCGQLLSRVSHVTATDGQPLVLLYEVDGHKYLEISHFRQRTRAKESKCPSPDRHAAVMRPSDDRHVTAIARLDGDGDVFGDGDGENSPLPPSPTDAESEPRTAELTRADQITVPDPGVFDEAGADIKREIIFRTWKEPDEKPEVFDVQNGWREFSTRYPNQTGVDAACRWYISEMAHREPPEQIKLHVEIMVGLNCYLKCARWRNHESGEVETRYIPSMDKFIGVPKQGDLTRGNMYEDHPEPWAPPAAPQPKRDKGSHLRDQLGGSST